MEKAVEAYLRPRVKAAGGIALKLVCPGRTGVPDRLIVCGRWFKYPRRRRQSTQYHDEESNYVTCCSDCFEEVEEHWAELWDEYYSGRL